MDKRNVVAAARFAAQKAEAIREMDITDPWEGGDLVQLDPDTVENKMLAGCIMVVTELRAWGLIGYVQMPGRDGQPGGKAYYRAKWEECRWVGKAMWMAASDAPAGFERDKEDA